MAADEIYEFTVSTPAHTTAASPLVTLIQTPVRKISRIDWRIPAGSLGVMGWRISMRGVQLIPKNIGGWIIAHETSGGWNVSNFPDSGDWSLTTYNTGAYAHLIWITLHASVVRKPPAPFTLIQPQLLSELPGPAWTGV